MEDIQFIDATELAGLIRAKTLSPVELLNACLDRIDRVNPKLNAVVTLVDNALDRARHAESAVMRGESLGPLHGVPFTVKDCINTAGIRTTGGSLIFKDFVPERNATVVDRLNAAGGVMMAKTNLPEFALWWETGNRMFGQTNNPWNLDRTPGGSSGGEAAAIFSGMSPIGIGSDVGGSIREPANYCGIVGLKATHGRIPLTGHWPEVLLRYMHVGPLTKTVRDAALVLPILSGADGKDPYALSFPDPAIDLKRSLQDIRIAVCPEGYFSPIATDVKNTVVQASKALEELGCRVELISLDKWDDCSGLSISDSIYSAEGKYWLTPIVKDKEEFLAPIIKRRLSAPQPSMKDYQKALIDCEILRQNVAHLFSTYDILLCPTGPVVAHPHGSSRLNVDGKEIVPRSALAATVPFDLTGSPAVTVPFGLSNDGLPVGVQLVGRHLDEGTVLCVAAALEQVRDIEFESTKRSKVRI